LLSTWMAGSSRLLTERPFGFLAQFPFSARGRIRVFVHVNDKVAGDQECYENHQVLEGLLRVLIQKNDQSYQSNDADKLIVMVETHDNGDDLIHAAPLPVRVNDRSLRIFPSTSKNCITFCIMPSLLARLEVPS